MGGKGIVFSQVFMGKGWGGGGGGGGFFFPGFVGGGGGGGGGGEHTAFQTMHTQWIFGNCKMETVFLFHQTQIPK